MVDAYIFDAVRSPRGKGKKSGSLHEITALSLLTQQLEAIKNLYEHNKSQEQGSIVFSVQKPKSVFNTLVTFMCP